MCSYLNIIVNRKNIQYIFNNKNYYQTIKWNKYSLNSNSLFIVFNCIILTAQMLLNILFHL